MIIELRRYCRLANAGELARLLDDPESIDTVPVNVTVDLKQVEVCVEALSRESVADRASWDAEIVQPLHSALRQLPHRVAADMRCWHWMCVAVFPRLVWERWHGSVPGRIDEALTPALAERFLGSPSLRGVSRNTLARLWWCGETLATDSEGYTLAKEILRKQDLFQAVFERQFGLYPPAARACVRAFRDSTEREWRGATRRLNHYLTTIVLETLSEEEILELLRR